MRSVWESLFLGGWQEEAHSVTFWAKETPVCAHIYISLCLIEKARGQHGSMPGQLLFRSSHIPKLPSALDCCCDSLHLCFEASRLTGVIHPLHTYNFMCRFKEERKEKGHRKQEGKVKLSFLTLSQGISGTFCSQRHMLISVWVLDTDLEELEMNKENLFCT